MEKYINRNVLDKKYLIENVVYPDPSTTIQMRLWQILKVEFSLRII